MRATFLLILPLLLAGVLSVDAGLLPRFFNPFRSNDGDTDNNAAGNVAVVKRRPFYDAEGQGAWRMFIENGGVSAMHMVLTKENKAVYFDSAIYKPSALNLTDEQGCRNIPGALRGEVDCSAHAASVDIYTGDVRPLKALTDTWCSSGGFSPEGVLVQTGGWRDGGRSVRYLDTCDTCDWQEFPTALSGERWYATNHILPDGGFVVIGGRAMFSYEFVPPMGQGNPTNINLPFLQETFDQFENNLYPFVHLSTDGNLFLFANNRAILFNPKTGKVIRNFPVLEGGARNYPSSGMSVLLPLDLNNAPADPNAPIPAEVLICGGSVPNAFGLAPQKQFPPALKSCGRISITDPNSKWQMEDMPMPRTLGDMLLLPNTEVLIINGASNGCAGWDSARNPVLQPLLYRPYLDDGRFVTLKASQIARMYHSTSAVLPDASILVAGSNTNPQYIAQGALFPTEVRMEKFYPPYLGYGLSGRRPYIRESTGPKILGYGQRFKLQFTMLNLAMNDEEDVMVTLYAPPYTTHGFSQNQRLIVLKTNNVHGFLFRVRATVEMPPSAIIAPPGYYLLFAVHKGIPSTAIWVKLQE